MHEFGLVTVCRSAGQQAFAAAGSAGVVGCFSGMNDAGLCVASHEGFTPHADRTFDPPAGPAWRTSGSGCTPPTRGN